MHNKQLIIADVADYRSLKIVIARAISYFEDCQSSEQCYKDSVTN